MKIKLDPKKPMGKMLIDALEECSTDVSDDDYIIYGTPRVVVSVHLGDGSHTEPTDEDIRKAEYFKMSAVKRRRSKKRDSKPAHDPKKS